ncbi:MAG TPA: YfiR family protein [Chryseosolibacter sp.]
MMMNFAKGMQWPASASKGNFIIGILEYPPLASELQSVSGKLKLGNRKVEIREFETPDAISECHILFIPAYKAKRLPDVLAKIGNFATLVVTNKIDYAKKGAGINFVLIGGKLKYEINSKAIEKRGVKISSDLKGMGILVE